MLRLILVFLSLALFACVPESTGELTPSVPFTLLIHPTAATPRTDGLPAPILDAGGNAWDFREDSRLRYPIPVEVGDEITGWALHLWRDGKNLATTAQLQRLRLDDHQHEDVGPAVSDPAELFVVLSAELTEPVDGTATYSLLVEGDGPGEFSSSLTVSGFRPGP